MRRIERFSDLTTEDLLLGLHSTDVDVFQRALRRLLPDELLDNAREYGGTIELHLELTPSIVEVLWRRRRLGVSSA